jgi:hypothetical protein
MELIWFGGICGGLFATFKLLVWIVEAMDDEQ